MPRGGRPGAACGSCRRECCRPQSGSTDRLRARRPGCRRATRCIPNASMNVLFPTPGTPLMPSACRTAGARAARARAAFAPAARDRPRALDQRDRFGERTPIAGSRPGRRAPRCSSRRAPASASGATGGPARSAALLVDQREHAARGRGNRRARTEDRGDAGLLEKRVVRRAGSPRRRPRPRRPRRAA